MPDAPGSELSFDDVVAAWAKAKGRRLAEAEVQRRRLPGITAEDLVWRAIGEAWRCVPNKTADDVIKYATKKMGWIALDLIKENFGKKATKSLDEINEERGEKAAVSLDYEPTLRQRGTGGRGRDEAHYGLSVGISILIDEARERILHWLPLAERVGDRDGAFGTPEEHASVLLHWFGMAEQPLVDDVHWPEGFSAPDGDRLPEELHLRAALWLLDPEWFPCSVEAPDSAVIRRRLHRGRERLIGRCRELDIEELLS